MMSTALMGSRPTLIEINEDAARILMNRDAQKFFTLRFAGRHGRAEARAATLATSEIFTVGETRQAALGFKNRPRPRSSWGNWAKMEERWFQVGDSKPVQEGDLTLRVSRLLATRLRNLGAKVSFVRNDR